MAHPDLVNRAEGFAEKAHEGQLKASGRPYFEHTQQVVHILRQVTNDPAIIAAGYLHDTVEHTETTYTDLLEEFGGKVANLVMEVTREERPDERGHSFPRLHSQEGVMIKFADRLSNISGIEALSEEGQQLYLHKSKFWE